MGRVIDAEDRRLLSQGIVLVGGGGSIILAAAAIIGLAWRVFEVAAG